MDQGIVQIGKKMKSSILGSITFFPDEIVSEILSWLKVKSLLRCKSVCKRWLDMIQDKEFIEMHMRRNKGRFHKFDPDGVSVNLDGFEEKIIYIDTCNGLLLEKRLSSVMPSPVYRIRNPSTKGILNLPDPPKVVVLMQMYLSSYTGSYIVVCVYITEQEPNLHLDLLDLGPVANDQNPNGHLSWRTIGISEFLKLSGQTIYYFLMHVSADGILYIFRGVRIGPRTVEVVCIDLGKKVSTTCTMPQSLVSYNGDEFRFMLCNDKPTILSVAEELKIWVLDDYKKQKWVEKVISLPYLDLSQALKEVIPFLIHEDEEDMLCWGYNFGYKLKSKVVCMLPPDTFDVAETLVSLKGMQPQRFI